MLQLGQANPEGSDDSEPTLQKEEISRFGFSALHSGQFRLDPSSPINCLTSKLSPHRVHWYSYIGMIIISSFFLILLYVAAYQLSVEPVPLTSGYCLSGSAASIYTGLVPGSIGSTSTSFQAPALTVTSSHTST